MLWNVLMKSFSIYSTYNTLNAAGKIAHAGTKILVTNTCGFINSFVGEIISPPTTNFLAESTAYTVTIAPIVAYLAYVCENPVEFIDFKALIGVDLSGSFFLI